MKVLLDTCAFIWLDSGERQRFGGRAMEVLDQADVSLVLSVATLWEMAIKRSLGKLDSTVPIRRLVEAHLGKGDFTTLGIHVGHLECVERFPWHHRNPFDRLIIAQALIESIPVLSADAAFDLYGVTRIWN